MGQKGQDGCPLYTSYAHSIQQTLVCQVMDNMSSKTLKQPPATPAAALHANPVLVKAPQRRDPNILHF